jgi:hypothetical protein
VTTTRFEGNTVSEETNKPQVFWVDRRRSERHVVANVSVEVTFETGEGKQSTERTFIEDVSDFGRRFTTKIRARQGDKVALRFVGWGGKIPPEEQAGYYEVMWVAPQTRGFTVGARLAQGEKPVEVDQLEGANAKAHEVQMSRERRADERLKLHSPIEAAGLDTSGAQFHERTRLENVSNAGCHFSLRHAIQLGSVVAIRPLGPLGDGHPGEDWRLFVVIWVNRKGNCSAAGVRGIFDAELRDTCVPADRAAVKRS